MTEKTGDFLLDAVNKAMAASDDILAWNKMTIGTGWDLRRGKLNGNTIPPVYVVAGDLLARVELDWSMQRSGETKFFKFEVYCF